MPSEPISLHLSWWTATRCSQDQRELHPRPTLRTRNDRLVLLGHDCHYLLAGGSRSAFSHLQQRPCLGKDLSLPWAQQPKGAHLHKSSGQHMLQKSMDERLGWQRATLDLLAVGESVTERHLVVHHCLKPVVAQSNAKDVGCEIL